MTDDVGKIGWIDMTVANANANANANGGRIVVGPRGLAGGRFCVIEDPGGATAALYQP